MTILKQRGQPAMAGRPYQDAVAQFLTMGWTTTDWDELDDIHTWGQADEQNHQRVRYWLRHPPERFDVPVFPATIRAVSARYGTWAPEVLNAYAAGASERFVTAYLAGQVHSTVAPEIAWTIARQCGLTEPTATGWAHTLLGRPNRISGPTILEWTALFGETAYLWPLAGFTFEEAATLRTAGKTVTEGQLRVMVALAGVTLPAGI